MSDKIDFKKTLDVYRASAGEFRLIEVPPTRYLMVDGHGDPNTSTAYAEALEALYPVAYKMKFLSQRALGRDYVVPPLEGLWWAEDMRFFTSDRDPAQWKWTMMLMVPEWIDQETFESALGQAAAKNRPARLDDIRLKQLSEGTCVQTLHVGPFEQEGTVLERMHQTFIPSNGLQLTGTHHEVYFNDPRRTAPEKLRTLLRQPVRPAVNHQEG